MKVTTRGKIVLALTVLGVLIGGVALAGTLYMRSIGVWGSSDPGKAVTIEIPEGASMPEIGKLLVDAGVIESMTGWRIGLFLEGDITVEAGTYQMRTGLIVTDALAVLAKGAEGPQFVTVTFPEGSWLEDFSRIVGEKTHISANQFQQVLDSGKVKSELVPDGETLEGALFPSTYQVLADETALDLAQRLVREMEKQVASVNMSRAEELDLTPYDILIVASMIEAETRVDDERPMVARVIYNRLQQGIPLGIDATVIYALGEHTQQLTQSDLEIDSPYNTRKVAGLPPTPIGAPGLASIEAAANPADGDWLYYVLGDCEGNHRFSESYDEFLQNKAAYQQLSC